MHDILCFRNDYTAGVVVDKQGDDDHCEQQSSTEQIQLQQNEAYSASCEYNHERVKSIQFNDFQ